MKELLILIIGLLIYIAVQLSNSNTRQELTSKFEYKNSNSLSNIKSNKNSKNTSHNTSNITRDNDVNDKHGNQNSYKFQNDLHLLNPIETKQQCNLNSNNSLSTYPIIRSVVPINIHTRGEPTCFSQIGVLVNDDNSNILPLFGRETWRGSHKWNYYTQTDKFVSVRLPVHSMQKDCSESFGCDELYNDDQVNIPQLNETFKVTIYRTDSPSYIPFV